MVGGGFGSGIETRARAKQVFGTGLQILSSVVQCFHCVIGSFNRHGHSHAELRY